VILDGSLIAAIEFKSQIGPSFGNNLNNRAEEAIGSATDLWAAYRGGAFKPSARPWLGYLMMLEDCPASTKPVRSWEPFFSVFPEFKGASYKQRYEILLTKLVRERLYDAACFILSNSKTGPQGVYQEPSVELCFHNFAATLVARAIAAVGRFRARPTSEPCRPALVAEVLAGDVRARPARVRVGVALLAGRARAVICRPAVEALTAVVLDGAALRADKSGLPRRCHSTACRLHLGVWQPRLRSGRRDTLPN